MKRIVHIITGLSANGAQNMLYRVCRYSGDYEHEIISLSGEGDMGERFRELGIRVHALNLGQFNLVSCLGRAVKICRKADIVDSWLYHADLFAFITARVLLRRHLIWNIRHQNLDPLYNKRRTLRVVRINSFLSRFVDCISYNSTQAIKNHKRYGYRGKKTRLVANGFEIDVPEKDRGMIRKRLGIEGEHIIIVTAGRWNALKGYSLLFEALRGLEGDYRLIMAGKGLDKDNRELADMIGDLGERVMLLGERDDIVDILSAGDIYVSSSTGESFSNAVGEAMAQGLACVVTDTGESQNLVGDAGIAVRAGDAEALREGLRKMISSDYREYGKKAKLRIQQWDIRRVVTMYQEMWG